MKKIFLSLVLIFAIVNADSLHLYGGSSHKQYLGCITCSEFDSNSICNEFGTYGNSFSSKSIWNEFSEFGNEFNADSPWNEYSSSAPVIVDKSGNFYGYFTINQYHRKRTEISLLRYFLDNFKNFETYEKAQKWLCKQIN